MRGSLVLAAAASMAVMGAALMPGQERLSDSNIVAMMAEGDSIEVALAGTVRSQTGNAAVRRYADMLLRDHARGLKEVHQLASRLKIRPEAPADDTATLHARHVEERLRALKGFDFDTAVSRHWIRDHQHDMQDTRKMIAQAHEKAVRSAAQKEMPTLRKHLAGAESLTRTLEREHGRGAAREERQEKGKRK